MYSRNSDRPGRRKLTLPVKYLILLFAFFAGATAYSKDNLAAGIAAAGTFIAYAIIEIQDLKIINQEEEEE